MRRVGRRGRRIPRLALAGLVVLAAAVVPVLVACSDGEASSSSVTTVTVVTAVTGSAGAGGSSATSTTTAAVATSTTSNTNRPAPQTFDEFWAASLAALDDLGPTRVTAHEVTTSRPDDAAASAGTAKTTTDERWADEVLDPAGARGRLTVRYPDPDRNDNLLITVRAGLEQVEYSTLSSSDATRRTFLQPPPGIIPLPLWAGAAVGPDESYADLLITRAGLGIGPAHGGGMWQIADSRVTGRTTDGGATLAWQRRLKEAAQDVTVTLDAGYLPVRIEVVEVTGPGHYDTVTVDYKYERGLSFADSYFSLEVPPNAHVGSVYHELPLAHPWSTYAGWGQYWLGEGFGEWRLTTAEHFIFGGYSPPDVAITFRYRRPGSTNFYDFVEMAVRPLGGWSDEHRSMAEESVANGNSVKRETTVAGHLATVSWSLPDPTMSPYLPPGRRFVTIFLPNAVVTCSGPVDPGVILSMLKPLEAPTSLR